MKRLKRSQSAGDAAEVVMVLQLLRKHKDCKKAGSRDVAGNMEDCMMRNILKYSEVVVSSRLATIREYTCTHIARQIEREREREKSVLPSSQAF